MSRFAWPAVGLAVLLGLLAVGLTLDVRTVPSPLVGRPAPAFSLPPLAAPGPNVAPSDWAGRTVVVNFWASWCAPCLQEHPLLLEQSRAGAPIVGIAYKDEDAASLQWLERHGNPFESVLRDAEGRAGLDWGVYGVPETYVVDATGVIRHKHVGPLTREAWAQQVAPWLEETREKEDGRRETGKTGVMP